MEGTAHVLELLGSLLKQLQHELAERQQEIAMLRAENEQLLERWRSAPSLSELPKE